MSRLSTVLRLRRIEEREALAEVARAEQAALQAEKEAEQRRRDRIRWAVPSGITLDAAGLRRQQIETLALADAEFAALADVAAAGVRRVHARDAWFEARTQLRSVERLAQHRAAQHAAEAAARAQAQADELALLMRRTAQP